jgi:hypothetical protein
MYAALGPAFGLVLGAAITLTSPFRDLPGWPAWAGIAIVLTAVAGAVFVYGIERWADLRTLQVIQVRDVTYPIVALAAFPVLVLIGQVALTRWTGTWRGAALVGLTLAGGAAGQGDAKDRPGRRAPCIGRTPASAYGPVGRSTDGVIWRSRAARSARSGRHRPRP